MPSFCPFPPKTRRRAFTLLEVLIAVALLLLILIALAQALDTVDHAWKAGASDPFASAQNAFESVLADLGGATLEPYQDYADAGGAFRTSSDFVPDHLARRSDLAFACGPAGGLMGSAGRTTIGSAVFFAATEGFSQEYAKSGLPRLLNSVGFFVEFGDDDSKPSFLSFAHSWRWRLRIVRQPAESLQLYSARTSTAWIQQLVPAGTPVPMLAENIVALVILPERNANDAGAALSPGFGYDSRDAGNTVTLHQLPPRARVVLVAIDALSAERLAAQNGSNPPRLVPAGMFQQAAQLNADLSMLDVSLTMEKIGHRVFQREIQLPSAAWSDSATR